MGLLYCLGCGRSKRAGEHGCPACLGDVFGESVSGSAEPAEREPGAVGGVLAPILQLPRGKVALLHGRKGIGKTTVALSMFDRPWVVTSEMDAGELLRYARRNGTPIRGARAPTWLPDPINQVLLNIPPLDERPDFVFDSLTASGHPTEALVAVRAWCDRYGVRAVVIAQQTKAGQARGSATLAFDVDVELELTEHQGKRRISIEKNRFGPEGSIGYELKEDGAQPPKFGRYYSVEGHLGRYRLARHPGGKKLRFADYLRAAEKAWQAGDEFFLPDPPLAVSAQRSSLYRGGWIEPDDWEARRDFAENQGVKYFSPMGA